MSSSTSTETKDPLRNVRKSMIMKPSLSKNSLEDYVNIICNLGFMRDWNSISAENVYLLFRNISCKYWIGRTLSKKCFNWWIKLNNSASGWEKLWLFTASKRSSYHCEYEWYHIDLIKRFLSSLQNPIIPFTSYKILMSKKPTVEFLAQTIAALPKLNFLTLMFLINFLT